MCRCSDSDREECEAAVKKSTQTKQFGFQANSFSFSSILLPLKYYAHFTLVSVFFLFFFRCHFYYDFHHIQFLTHTAAAFIVKAFK